MSVTILVCPCGRRLKAAGLAQGARGRCPDCGRLIRMPGDPPAATSAIAPPPEVEDEWNWKGTYGLEEPAPLRSTDVEDPAPDETAGDGGDDESEPVASDSAVSEDEWSGIVTGYALGADEPAPRSTIDAGAEAGELADSPPIPARVAPTRREPAAPRREPWWPPQFFYPFRAAEGSAMVASLGLAFWVLATLVPEYCLALLADAEKLGTPSMGRLVALISSLPSLMMTPLVLIYWLQYLARILVASAEGEGRPPRPSDRNFEGLLGGLSPWMVWLVLGLVPGLLPLVAYLAAAGEANPWAAAGLGLAGLPYMLVALAMGFLHDDPLAAKPAAVLGTVARLSPSFLVACLTIAATLGLGAAAFAGSFALREGHFWLYVPACLAAWMLMIGTSFVAMRTLGSYFGLRNDLLKWRRKRIRWGVNWTL